MSRISHLAAFGWNDEQPAMQGAEGRAPAALAERMSAASDLYAAAWAQSRRDFELDRLFNAEFYQGRDI
jgi:hypothetical protein